MSIKVYNQTYVNIFSLIKNSMKIKVKVVLKTNKQIDSSNLKLDTKQYQNPI